MVQSLVDDSDPNNPKMDYSGISIGRNQVSFGFYEASGSGPQTLTAGIIVDKINNGTVTINAGKVVMQNGADAGSTIEVAINGKLTANQIDADFINSKYSLESAIFRAKKANISGQLTAGTVLASSILYNFEPGPGGGVGGYNDVGNAIMGFKQDNITYSGTQVTIPFTRINGSEGTITFNSVTSVTGSWSGNKYTVYAGSEEKTYFTVNARFQNTPSGYSIEAIRTDKGSSTAVSIAKTSLYYELGLTGEKSSSTVVLRLPNGGSVIQNTPSIFVGDLYTSGQNSMGVSGSWDNNVFTYKTATNQASSKAETISLSGDGNGSSTFSVRAIASSNNATVQSGVVGMELIKSGTTSYIKGTFNGVQYGSLPVGTLYEDGQNAIGVSGYWNGASFNFKNDPTSSKKSDQTSVTIRWGTYQSGGSWQQNTWAKNNNDQWITFAEARNPQGGLIISTSEINANPVFNEGLKAATVNGKWSGLTFEYWNTSNKSATTTQTSVSVQYGYTDSGGWHPNQWTTENGDKVTYVGVFNNSTLLNSATKIKAPTQGLYINSGTGTIEISSSSAETSVPIKAEASISYNAGTHTYTATGTAKASSTTMGTSTKTGGSEAYTAGINAGSTRITLTNGGSRSSISSGINLTSYGTVYEIDANYMMANGTLSNSVTHLYVKTPSDRYHAGWNAGGNAAAFTMGPTSSYMQNTTVLPYSTTYIVYAYYMTHDSSTGADAGTSMCSQGLMYFNTPSDRYHTGWNAGGNAAAFTIGPYGYYVQSAATLAYNTTYIMYAYYMTHDSSTGSATGTSMCAQGPFYYNTPIDTGSTAKFVFTEAAYDGVSPSYTLEIGKKYLCYPYYTSANGQTYETPGRQYYYINPPTSNQYYTGGWNAARSALSYPPSQDYASSHHSRAVFRIPASTVDASGAKNYYLAMSSALSGNTLTVHAALYSGGTANGITVALESMTYTTPAAPGYTSGWRSAYNMMSWPAKQNFDSTYYTRAVFYYPSYTVDQSRSSAYWLAMSSSIENGVFWAYASLHAGTITGNVVALNRLSYKIPDAPTVTISYTQQSASQSPGGLAPTTSAIKLNKYTTPNTYNYLKITAGGKTQWFYY